MEPFYFGSGEKRLFAVYHPAEGDAIRERPVVLCPPFGQEFIRAHRAFGLLAQRLAAAGFHSLRFDYFGCGDSPGDLAEVDLEHWKHDIAAAIDELRDGVGTDKVCLVGLRLGATLAAFVGAERDDVDRLVLWEPILHGADYLDELKAQHVEWLRESHLKPQPAAGEDQGFEAVGFVVSPSLATAISSLDLTRADAKPANRILLVDNTNKTGLLPLLEHYHSLKIETDHRFVPASPVWKAAGSVLGAEGGEQLVRSDVTSLCVTWLTEGNP